MNTFGRLFRFTSFGESHGPAIGGVLDGCPSGLRLDKDLIDKWLARRSPRGATSTSRAEKDSPEFLSGLTREGVTTGAPIAFILSNRDIRSKDYDPLKQVFRPSHADYTYYVKYGVSPMEGGGRASARETAARVVAGAVAAQYLSRFGIEILSYTSSVGNLPPVGYFDDVTLEEIEAGRAGCPDRDSDAAFYRLLEEAKAEGDTLGGSVTTIVRGVPAGWGEPLYDKLHARLAAAMIGINAARAYEIGEGIGISRMKGSVANDPFVPYDGGIRTDTNRSGGVQGGISNGEILRMRTYFKPISSIRLPQETVTLTGEPRTITIEGRHDTGVFPRVLPVCDAMAALVLADFSLLSSAAQSSKA